MKTPKGKGKWLRRTLIALGIVLVLWVGSYAVLRSVKIEPYMEGQVARIHYFDKTVEHCYLTKGKSLKTYMHWGLAKQVSNKGMLCRVFIPLEYVELFLRGTPRLAGPTERTEVRHGYR